MLGVDIGTNSCKTTIVGTKGEVLGSASQEYPTTYPKPMWAEQDPEDWYKAFKNTLKKSMAIARIRGKDILSIGVTGMGCTAVFLDENGDVLRPAMVWTDQRDAAQVTWLEKNIGQDRILSIAGNQATTIYTLPKLLWVKDHQPSIWKKLYKIQLPKDYIRLKLTGKWVMDYSDAGGTLIFDVNRLDWSEEICASSGIPRQKLPNALPCSDVIGCVTKNAADDLELAEGTPVIAGTSDVAAESVTAGNIHSGQILIRLGTAAAILIVAERAFPDPKSRWFTVPHALRGRWIVGTGTQSSGSSYRWFIDTFCHEEKEAAKKSGRSPYAIMDNIASKAPVGSEGLLYHPYLIGERCPYCDPYLKGSFFGFTLRHKKEHFTRAVLEGVAFSITDCMNALGDLNIPTKTAKLIGGGAKSPLWRRIVCDMLGIEVLKPMIEEACYGAALLSGIGVKLFRDYEEAIQTCVKTTSKMEPNEENHKRYEKLFRIYKKVHDDLCETSHLLHNLVEETS